MKWSIQCHLWSHLPLDGFTPAHIAAQYGCLKVVKFISTKAEILNCLWMPDERLPIHLASANGHTEVAEFFASKIDNLNILDHYGNAPIHYAAANGHLETVKFIATKVENPNFVTHYGLCPFMLAYRNNHNDVTKILFPHTTKDSTYLLKVPVTFALKCAWKESQKTFDFIQSSTFRSFLIAIVLNIISIFLTFHYILMWKSNSSISIPTLSSNNCHISEHYDYFHSLNVTYDSLSEITNDDKKFFPNCDNIFVDLFCFFISFCTKRLRKVLLPECHSHPNGGPPLSLKYVLFMYLTLSDPLPDPSIFSWSMFFIQVECISLLVHIITNTCPKHYMQPHTALTPLQVAVNTLYFAICIYYCPYFAL